MKKNLPLIILFLICFVTRSAFAEDIYLYYSTKDPNGRTIDTKAYTKNGDARMEIIINMNGIKMTSASLILKKNPNELITLDARTKTYTKRAKPKKKPTLENYTITVIGKEKVGDYNCTHVHVKSSNKSFDMWLTKDLPTFTPPIENSQANISKKLSDELARKGILGMMVKSVYFNPGANVPKLTMELVKYEIKPLDALLFKIPSDYKESKGNPYSNLSPEKRKEMMQEMMEQLKDKRTRNKG